MSFKIRDAGLSLRSPGELSRHGNAYILPEYATLPAYLNFAPPTGSRPPLADRAINKPAEMTRIEFPGRTVLPRLRRASPDIPAGPVTLRLSPMQSEQKKDLPLDMHGNLSPPLLKALDCLEGRPQKLG